MDAVETLYGMPRLLDIDGSFTTLDVPGATDTYAYGINADGQIVGQYVDVAAPTHGFLLSEGTYTTLDAPITTAYGINDIGQIV